MSKVFLLGAGFSWAVSEDMPLMPDLDRGVRRELRARARERPDAALLPLRVDQFGDFEAWLSYLAADQPWLSAAENLRNRAAFLDVSSAVDSVLRVGETHATVDQDMPPWLGRLVRYWQRDESTVITFNYDRLVEYAFLHTWSGQEQRMVESLYRVPLTLSTARAGYALAAGDDRRAFPLLKLHGSLNWYYSGPDAASGDNIYLEPTYDAWARPEPHGNSVEQDDYWLYAGTRERVDLAYKVPLIVPPASAKSAYYANLGLRAQWAAAAAALAGAEELVVMGYSLPATDELARALLLTSVRAATVHSVDLGTDPYDRLVAMFGEERVIPTLAGRGRAVEEYVHRYCQDADEG